jgi:Raf kinase inhibitor-like YbhB/YbcL family protein
VSRRLAVSSVALAIALTVGAACSSDGRGLRPPGPDQTLSVITTTTSTTTTAATAANGGTRAAGINEGVGDEGMVLTAPWTDSSAIPAQFTCKGANVSPAVSWSHVPPNTKELALALTDPDANNFVHWVLTGIDPASTGIAEAKVPAGAAQTVNDAKTLGYTGPCPPNGTHSYLLTLYALKRKSGIAPGSAAKAALGALDRNEIQLASISIEGTFGS